VTATGISTIGVIGAGTIGRGVAHCFAESGFRVELIDVSRDQLDSALAQIESDLLLFSMYGTKPPTASAAEVIERIDVGTELDRLAGIDFVVENVTENWDVKREVYEQLGSVCRPGVIFGVNTSAIPITRVAAATDRPAEVIGLHFMNPVPLMTTVEVMRGHFTSERTVERSLELLTVLDKVGITVNDAPGFVTNRVLMLTINEAICCLHEQVATAEQVDQIFRGCFGHKMGPLETADLIGLDTVLYSITGMYESFRDSKYRPSPLLQRMVDAGLLGRKSGTGFYSY
jgi:3-hydroxybutyryl-CoA dehydrogenase